MANVIVQGTVDERGDALVMARIRRINDGEPATSTDFSEIKFIATEAGNVSAVSVGPNSLEPADVVFDELRRDHRWTVDEIGYNFAATIPKEAFPDDKARFVTLKFTFANGIVAFGKFDMKVRKTLYPAS